MSCSSGAKSAPRHLVHHVGCSFRCAASSLALVAFTVTGGALLHTRRSRRRRRTYHEQLSHWKSGKKSRKGKGPTISFYYLVGEGTENLGPHVTYSRFYVSTNNKVHGHSGPNGTFTLPAIKTAAARWVQRLLRGNTTAVVFSRITPRLRRRGGPTTRTRRK